MCVNRLSAITLMVKLLVKCCHPFVVYVLRECVRSELAAIKGCAAGPVRAIPECIASRCVTT